MEADITIREARKGDAKRIAEFYNIGQDRGFFKYIAGNRKWTAKDIRVRDKAYAEKKKGRIVLIAIDNGSGDVVGMSSFVAAEEGRTRHRGVMGWFVHPDHLESSIGTKVVRAVLNEARKRGFKRAWAEVAVENVASVKLAKKCGFEIEGRERAGMLLDNGRYADVYLFGRSLK